MTATTVRAARDGVMLERVPGATPMTCAVVPTPEGPIEYSSWGRGRPVVVVHGGQSSCIDTTLRGVLDPAVYRVITPSRPGYRNTPLQGRTQPRDIADLFAALLATLGLEAVIVIGISCGGLPAIELAARHPTRVEALVLASAITRRWTDSGGSLYRRSRRLFRPQLERVVWASTRVMARVAPRRMTALMHSQLSTVRGAAFDDDEIAYIRRRVMTLRSYRGFIHDLDHDIGDDALARVACPALVLHSVNDRSVSLDHARRAADAIPGATLHTYDNKWGHFLWIGDCREQAARDLCGFLDGLG